MIHGANIFKYDSNGEILDFSSNINPLGAPKIVYDIIKRDAKNIERYPDIEYRKLYSDISEAYNLSKENILIGNGAIELIDRIISIYDRIFVFAPCFSEYELRAKVYNKEIFNFNLNSNFSIDFNILEKFDYKKNDLIIITNPNNPNGRILTEIEHKMLIEIINKSNAHLMLDEAFIEFCETSYNSLNYMTDNIYIIRAATKFYSLPGLRLGMLFSSVKNINRIKKLVPLWSVGSLLENIGVIFKDEDYKNKSRLYIKNEREFLIRELNEITEIEIKNSDANFLLIDLKLINEEYIFEEFLKRKILVRTCKNYRNLDGNFIRVAVKDRESNLKFLNAFKEIVNR